MKWGVLLAAIILGCAGCLQPEPEASAMGPEGATPTGNPLDVVNPQGGNASVVFEHVIATAFNGGEPELLVVNETTWFLGAIRAGEPILVKTTDGGKTWMDWTTPLPAYGSNDETITMDKQGRLWVGNMWARNPEPPFQQGAFCTVVGFQSAEDPEWVADANSCVLPNVERPWLAAYEDGVALLQVEGNTGRASASASLRVRANDGTGWSDLQFAGASPGSYSQLEATTEGLGFLVSPAYGSNPMDDQSLYSNAGLVLNEYDGSAWSSEALTDEHVAVRWPTMAYHDGLAHAAWATLSEQGTQLKLLTETESGWREPIVIADGAVAMPWMSSHPEGGVAVTWLQADENAHPEVVSKEASWRIHVWHNGQQWNGTQIIMRGPVCQYGFVGPCDDDTRVLGDFIGSSFIDAGRIGVPHPVGTKIEGLFDSPLQIAVFEISGG